MPFPTPWLVINFIRGGYHEILHRQLGRHYRYRFLGRVRHADIARIYLNEIAGDADTVGLRRLTDRQGRSLW